MKCLNKKGPKGFLPQGLIMSSYLLFLARMLYLMRVLQFIPVLPDETGQVSTVSSSSGALLILVRTRLLWTHLNLYWMHSSYPRLCTSSLSKHPSIIPPVRSARDLAVKHVIYSYVTILYRESLLMPIKTLTCLGFGSGTPKRRRS